MNPLCITGMGIVSALGIGKESFYEAMDDPRTHIQRREGRTEAAQSSRYPQAHVTEIQQFDAAKYLGDKGLRILDRLTKLLVVATRLTMHDAGYKKDGAYVQLSPERVGLCSSNAYGSLEAVTELGRVAILEDARYINPAKFPNTVSNSAAGYASIWEDLRALNVSVSDGNCGALDVVACADIFLQAKRADAILVGGAEAISEALYLAFHKLGALESQVRLGEGASFFSLESEEVATHRGAHCMAKIIGYGTAVVSPKTASKLIYASEQVVEKAIHLALQDSQISKNEIDIVASGLSGLPAFDQAELTGIQRVLGPKTCIAAPKLIFGETLGAGGAMNIAALLAWFQGVKPSALVAGSPPPSLKTALVTAMGFYGNASAVILCRP
ncbi:beta-ketoacyl synthase N-terminal-like domain-containing protein [Pajaroellobacter abortibovis]|uniref:Ketosynthase family 3 (KS3) domain-containing protein n=1 Tax=Pajaroellobacter abortibovis TaxID=1882918 RepID=A0A1L6MVU5_9BACT|nr:beta-ketoacyl synthase N-terminal-like domain-containing protein [Pajaroellobacter abortibovis]APR99631.1 hypothetical protein BCY86_02275 [Pajaroellobacter abortibovis]